MNDIIQNVVSTAFLGRTIDLNFVANNAANIEYNTKNFVAAIIRLRNPRVTTLIFKSGRMVCTGAKTIEENKKGARRVARIIQKICKSKKITFKNYIVQNIVGSFKVDYKIDLIAFNCTKQSFYDPHIFPGLKFRPFNTSNSTILIFISGKVIITGVKEIKQLYEIRDYMVRILLKFKRSFPYTSF